MKQAKMIDKHVRARRADLRDAEVGRRVRGITGVPHHESTARTLCRGLDLWAKVRRDMDRPAREVSTIRPNTA